MVSLSSPKYPNPLPFFSTPDLVVAIVLWDLAEYGLDLLLLPDLIVNADVGLLLFDPGLSYCDW